MKMLAAKIPTKPAAIHSIVSMKRSIDVRFISAPHGFSGLQGESTAAEGISAAVKISRGFLLGQGVVLGKRSPQFSHRRVRIGPGLPDVFGPGLDQRFGRLLPERGLLYSQCVDFLTRLRPHLVAA